MTELHLVKLHGEFEKCNTRVMILVHDMSFECALQMYEVSLKYL